MVDLSETLSTLESELLNFEVFPNPISNYLNIKSAKPIDQLEITNIGGKSILKLNYLPLANKVNISKLESGIYFITVKMQNILVTKKIVKK